MGWDGMGWDGMGRDGSGRVGTGRNRTGGVESGEMVRHGKGDGVRWETDRMEWDGMGQRMEKFRDGTGKWMGLTVLQRRDSACALRCTLSACLKSQPSE